MFKEKNQNWFVKQPDSLNFIFDNSVFQQFRF